MVVLSHIAKIIEKAAINPLPAQTRAFCRLKRRIGSSALAKKTGFDRITTLEQARLLPITNYELLEQDLREAEHLGVKASSLYGVSPLVALAQTSGTTRAPKTIPWNRDAVRASFHFVFRMNCVLIDKTKSWTWLFKGQTLSLFARPQIGFSPGGLPIGFISGLVNRNLPYWMRRRVEPPASVQDLGDWDEKITQILEVSAGRDVRMVAGIPSLLIHFGEQVIARKRVSCLRDIWPGIRGVFFSGSAVTGVDRARINELIAGRREAPDGAQPLMYWSMYAATEGMFGYGVDAEGDLLMFDPYDVFFQFFEDENTPLRQLHELEAGKRYAILVTTPGGLINYRVGDWIEVVSTAPVLFRVCSRDAEGISLASEKILPSHLAVAVDQVNHRYGLKIAQYAVCLERGSPNRLVWVVSGGVGAAETETHILVRAFDEALSDVNPFYGELHRTKLIYGDCRVEFTPEWRFTNYIARNLNRGQFKPKRLFQSRHELDRVLGS